MAKLCTDDTRLVILAHTHWPLDQLGKDCGYEVFVSLGVADDANSHVMLAIGEQPASRFIHPWSVRSDTKYEQSDEAACVAIGPHDTMMIPRLTSPVRRI